MSSYYIHQLGYDTTYDIEKKNPTSHDVADTSAVLGRRVGKTRRHVFKTNCGQHLKRRHFQLRRHGFDRLTCRTPGSLCRRGWARPSSNDFSRINKLKEKIIYFFCLNVDDNNCTPAVSNGSQNGMHCCRGGAIIYELH